MLLLDRLSPCLFDLGGKDIEFGKCALEALKTSTNSSDLILHLTGAESKRTQTLRHRFDLITSCQGSKLATKFAHRLVKMSGPQRFSPHRLAQAHHCVNPLQILINPVIEPICISPKFVELGRSHITWLH